MYICSYIDFFNNTQKGILKKETPSAESTDTDKHVLDVRTS